MRYWAPQIIHISNLKPRNSKYGRTVLKGEILVPKLYIYISNLKPRNSKEYDRRTVLKGEILGTKN